MVRLNLAVIGGKDPFLEILRERFYPFYYLPVGLLTELGGVLISDFHCVLCLRFQPCSPRW
jgi:hypothetical protein